jgi:hypothetical protein
MNRSHIVGECIEHCSIGVKYPMRQNIARIRLGSNRDKKATQHLMWCGVK